MPSAGPIVPAQPPGPIDPCRSEDPCTHQISDIVRSNNNLATANALALGGVAATLLTLTTATAANTAAIAAATAALTPIPFLVKKFVSCDGETPVFGSETVNIPANSLTYVAKLFDRLANIEAQKCRQTAESNTILSIPEWWEVRLEANRPQLVYIFREYKEDGTATSSWFSVSIPHPRNTTRESVTNLPNYRKGNWEAILTLTDNSKVIINGKNRDECIRMIEAAKQLILPDKINPALTLKVNERIATNVFIQRNVRLWRIDYYSRGLKKGVIPDWRKRV